MIGECDKSLVKFEYDESRSNLRQAKGRARGVNVECNYRPVIFDSIASGFVIFLITRKVTV